MGAAPQRAPLPSPQYKHSSLHSWTASKLPQHSTPGPQLKEAFVETSLAERYG